MPPKKSDGTKAKSSSHASYQDMITDAIVSLKDRNGSSRQSLKKYVKANNNLNVSDNMFDALFNKALKSGVEKGIFDQPRGSSGGTKLAKKAASKKDGGVKKAAPKKAAPKKATAAKPKAAAKPKKATATKKAATPKKAAAPRKSPSAALSKPKTGRVTKPAAKKTSAKKATPKKAAPKKAKA